MLVLFFFFNDTATTEIYTLSLHDALPIFRGAARRGVRPDRDAAFLSGRVVSRVLGGTAVDPGIRGGAPLAAAVGIGRAGVPRAPGAHARDALDRVSRAHDPRRDARRAVERLHSHGAG